MGTPQIILLVLVGVNLLLTANKHGKPRENENFWTSLISAALTLGLLYLGGFFNQ